MKLNNVSIKINNYPLTNDIQHNQPSVINLLNTENKRAIKVVVSEGTWKLGEVAAGGLGGFQKGDSFNLSWG